MTTNEQPVPRGFSYALAPYLRRQEWQMERLQARLARQSQGLAQAQAQLQAKQAQLQAHAAQMRQSLQSRLDPQAHRRGLAFLSALHAGIARQNQEIETLQAQKTALQTECLAQQRGIDGLLEHRAGAMRDHAQQAARAEAAQADRDWVSRHAIRTQMASPLGESVE